ncbi:hypothetical protein CEE45_01550 [Candidatus Heimdallarchaeota archaeon B3_Heim]|nr:MAG: hypothetical protein CEE45_01550 [Candidatus Heimdallarchaeota archaeon B3_Heim]
MQNTTLRKRRSLTVFPVVFLFFLSVLVPVLASPYTAEITTLTPTIDTSTSSTYEKTIGVKLIWRINYDKSLENFSTIYSYVYCKVSGKSPILAASQVTEGGSTYWYTNYTSITETLTLNIDEDSVAGQDLSSDVKIAIYAELYNNSISAANKLTSKTASISYGSLVGEEAAETADRGLWDYALLILMGLGAFVVLVFIILAGQRYVIPWLGLSSPPRNTLDYGDRTKWAERYGPRDKEVLQGKKKAGQFKDIVDPGRSRRIDQRQTHLHGRKPGQLRRSPSNPRKKIPDADRRPPKGKKW